MSDPILSQDADSSPSPLARQRRLDCGESEDPRNSGTRNEIRKFNITKFAVVADSSARLHRCLTSHCGSSNPTPKPDSTSLSSRQHDRSRIRSGESNQGTQQYERIWRSDSSKFNDSTKFACCCRRCRRSCGSPNSTPKFQSPHSRASSPSTWKRRLDCGEPTVPDAKKIQRRNSEKTKFEIRILNTQGLTPPTSIDSVGVPRVCGNPIH
jgi:hypothetical protein